MTHKLPWTAVVLASMMSCVGAADAGAATITSVSSFVLPGASTGSIGPVGATPAPNNDNSPVPSQNAIAASMFLNAGGFGPADFEFAVSDSGGTTEYILRETVVNTTGVPWTDFHFELGFGTGAGFLRAPVGVGLDFDTPDADPAPTATVFPTLVHQPVTIDWSGGLVPSVGPVLFTLSIDVPDNLVALNPSGLNRFTLRQFPTNTPAPVPEPASVVLLGGGLAGLVAARRRRA